PFVSPRGSAPAAAASSVQPSRPRTRKPLYSILPLIALACAILGIGWYLRRFTRPVQVFVEDGSPKRLEMNKTTVLYGPQSKQTTPGIELDKEKFALLPPGELATIRNIGGGKVLIEGSSCTVQNPEQADNRLSIKRGDNKEVRLKPKNGGLFSVKVTVA
ncbi:MAG TPA: hypothetical protein VGS41_11825, partial [Chthonomonadales bacterium]|nr:hypothetical protein [Chthonomonadales bacterium]